MKMPEPTQPLSPATVGGPPDLAQQFWALCSGPEPHPDVRDFVRQAGSLSPQQLVAVLCVDLRQRWQRGEAVRVESYLLDFADLEQHADSLLDLVYTELLLLEESGQSLNLEDYRQRFPGLFERLKEQVEFGRLLRAGSHAGMQEGARGGEELPFPSVPGYEILEPLGEGGMGVVYRARQHSLGREVALKMLKETPGGKVQQMERFLREASTIARLKHPNIVQIHEIGEHHGLPYLCLEYVAGGTLADRLGKGPLSPREAAAMVQALARTMHSVHQEGIIHRDLKPGNVLLCREGEAPAEPGVAGPRDVCRAGKTGSAGASPSQWVPKITDFGLARLLDSESDLTRTGSIMGTPSYMAPEQAEGKSASIGPASDIWALGAILYALLIGRPPFLGQSVMETLEQVRHADPVPPRRLRAGLSRDLETICLKCLDKNPLGRYGSAAELAEELGRFLADEPIRARPLGPSTRMLRWARRRPAPAALLVLVVGIATVGFPTVLWLWRTAQQTAASETEARKELQTQLYYNQIALAQEMLSLGNVARADELLDSLPPDRRGWEWHFLKRLRYGPPASITWPGQRLAWLAFSPDSRSLALCSMAGEVQVRAVGTGEVLFDLQPAKLSPLFLGCQFSPDGKRLALVGPRKTVVRPNRVEDVRSALQVVDLESGEKLFSKEGPRGLVREVVWSRAGDRLAVGGGDGTIKIWDSNGEELLTLRGHANTVHAVAFSPDGRTLASASADATVKLWDVASGEERGTYHGAKAALITLVFSPDGQRIYAGGFEGIIKGWDVRTGKQVLTAHSEGGGLLSLAISPDGRRLAGSGVGRPVQLWDAETGHEVLMLRGHTDSVPALAFSSDGQRLATASWDGTVKIWDATLLESARAPEEIRTCRDRDIVFALAYTPDGRELVSGNLEGQLKLWDVATGQQQRCWQGHSGPVAVVAMNSDGKRLASLGADGALRVWDLRSGEELLAPLTPGWAEVRGTDLAFSPDGRYLAAPFGISGLVKVWESASGKEVRSFPGHRTGCYSVSFAPDSRHLASSGYDECVRIWDLQTGEKVQTLEGHQHLVIRQVFSPSGKTLASASWDNTVKIWDIASGKELLTLRHDDRLVSLAYRADGRVLVTGSFNGAVKLWDATTGKELGTLRGHSGICWFVAFAPDGSSLASASGHRGEGEITFWDLTRLLRDEGAK